MRITVKKICLVLLFLFFLFAVVMTRVSTNIYRSRLPEVSTAVSVPGSLMLDRTVITKAEETSTFFSHTNLSVTCSFDYLNEYIKKNAVFQVTKFQIPDLVFHPLARKQLKYTDLENKGEDAEPFGQESIPDTCTGRLIKKTTDRINETVTLLIEVEGTGYQEGDQIILSTVIEGPRRDYIYPADHIYYENGASFIYGLYEREKNWGTEYYLKKRYVSVLEYNDEWSAVSMDMGVTAAGSQPLYDGCSVYVITD